MYCSEKDSDLRSRVDGEFQFRFLAIVNRQPFHEKRCKSRTSASAERVEDKETLKTSALIGKFTNSVQYKVDNLFANGVVSTSIVVCCIFLTSDQLLWMEKLPVGPGPYLIYTNGKGLFMGDFNKPLTQARFLNLITYQQQLVQDRQTQPLGRVYQHQSRKRKC